jgi:hypothetical protein
MLRDEDIYPNADAFLPERFLEPADDALKKRRDPRNYVFGFGRRRCPGMHLIEESLWIVMASMIAVFDFSNPINEKGRVIKPKVSFDNSVFRFVLSCYCASRVLTANWHLSYRTPSAFECDIRPRSEQALHLLRLSE